MVEFEVTPTDDLQMVVWLEDTAGNYVDTLFITRKTGSYGGIPDNCEPDCPPGTHPKTGSYWGIPDPSRDQRPAAQPFAPTSSPPTP